MSRSATCDVCWRHCVITEGATGFCRARTCQDGHVVAGNYGRLTSVAIDPVEKKPLAEWHPGARVLSVGSYGCNMRCPFCQNFEISQEGATGVPWREILPQELVDLALVCAERDPAVIGIAHTYNEPLVGWEYVQDCSVLARKASLANVLVSNGCACANVIDALAPLLDAANIDLKCFSADGYRNLGGSFEDVRHTIEVLGTSETCHLEVTTLVVPGVSDSEAAMREEAAWLASVSENIVLHITRFFPQWHMADAQPTPVPTVIRLADVAREYLPHVHVGNC
ncbi:MAG: AmmeMemoRadiSam system radical SAM enzyme [Olsenella sp.]|nr:AmmeMemoRadiSam system radical SAM enzyme [Olsenella sp.]MCI1793606.1 AmmeMemoRadiSam system radical SAM enzyme [Olsenella sp.]MCI1810511.1 AmmeMemoRadiSam system radical SAM enzyme [Olsenella sp.]MCI1880434.1 AmmeMemoRadiSam system radical SAM enzyme [Olsenella sp.]